MINFCPFLFCSIYIDIAIFTDRDYHICSSFINNFSLVNIVDDQMSILINTYNCSNAISSIISFFTIFPIYNVIACVCRLNVILKPPVMGVTLVIAFPSLTSFFNSSKFLFKKCSPVLANHLYRRRNPYNQRM